LGFVTSNNSFFSRPCLLALDFGKRKIKEITFDPHGRFPDANAADDVWTGK
jgi:hypothetical protein